MIVWTAEAIQAAVNADIDRLFAPWAVGRPETWKPDPATKTLVAVGYWLREELEKTCNEADTRTQLWKYNRFSRTYNVWQTAADVLNEALEGDIEQNRRGHRRWG